MGGGGFLLGALQIGGAIGGNDLLVDGDRQLVGGVTAEGGQGQQRNQKQAGELFEPVVGGFHGSFGRYS